jgi:hypothetical protein
MPKRLDHGKARAELARLPPDSMQAITLRMPAAMLARVHQFAEERKADLTSAVRELVVTGFEARGQLANVDAKCVKKWAKPVENAIRAGQSPIEPFLESDATRLDVVALPAILAGLDYVRILGEIKKKRGADEPWIDRVWQEMRSKAPSYLRESMTALDSLEQSFRARKKLFQIGSPEGNDYIMHWLMSDEVMQNLANPVSNEADVEAVRKLIAARFLVAEVVQQPWDFKWDT